MSALHDRIVKRLMTFGGFQRTERGEFWVSRDDVLRLLEEEFGADSVEGPVRCEFCGQFMQSTGKGHETCLREYDRSVNPNG